MKKMYYIVFLFSLISALVFGKIVFTLFKNSIIIDFQMTTGPDAHIEKWGNNLKKKCQKDVLGKTNYEEVFVKNELYDSNGPIYPQNQNYIVLFDIVDYKTESEGGGGQLYPVIEIKKIFNPKELYIFIGLFILFVCSTIISSYGIWLTLLLPKVVV